MTTPTSKTVRELHSRSSDGLDVRLWWNEGDGRTHVSVVDAKSGHEFAIEVRDGDRALDVFYHPYAYAAREQLAPSALAAALVSGS